MNLDRTGFCHGCGRACDGVFCVRQFYRCLSEGVRVLTVSDAQCRRRYEREQAVQANRAIRRGKRANYGVTGVN